MVSQIVQKVTSEHLQRKAYLYVRQSSLQQVHTNRESTERQYALQQRAVELGWPRARIVIIDVDQGHVEFTEGTAWSQTYCKGNCCRT